MRILPEQIEPLRSTTRHELGHIVVGTAVGLPFDRLILEYKLADEDEYPDLAARRMLIIGGAAHFDRMCILRDDQWVADPAKGREIACTGLAGVLCELLASGRSPDLDTVVRIMFHVRNSQDRSMIGQALQTPFRKEVIPEYLDATRALIAPHIATICTATERIVEHVVEVDSNAPLPGISLPYIVPHHLFAELFDTVSAAP